MGKTILISSHILSELADCCTLIGIIERGKLLMLGPIEDVYHRIQRNRILEIRFLDGSTDAGALIIRSMPETRDIQIEEPSLRPSSPPMREQMAVLVGTTRCRRRRGCTRSPTRSRLWRMCSCWSRREPWHKDNAMYLFDNPVLQCANSWSICG